MRETNDATTRVLLSDAFEITRDAFEVTSGLLALTSKRVLEYSRCLCHEYSSTCNAFERTRDHAFEITTQVLVSDAFEVTRDLCLLQIASYLRNTYELYLL